jgi:hypothetical protein
MKAIVAKCGPLDKALEATGKMELVASLAATKDTTSVRPRQGKPPVTDGPYVETKEQLGGYFVIEAPDLDAAIKWAARCPGSHHGSVEVRPVWEM